jgi:transcriptional regulator with XRE-family HTH domain
MGKRKGDSELLSEQLRRIIESGDMSRYELAKRSGVDASQLCRFFHGKGRLTTDSLDRIGMVLGLSLDQQEGR